MESASGIGVFAALFAGLVSFLSPCVLPLVPGYISAVVGVSPRDLQGASARRVLVPSLLFVASFSTIFILLGLGATAIGASLQQHKGTLEKVSGVVIICMGLFFLLTPFVTRLNREWRVDSLMRRAGHGGPFVAGAAFAIAWSPCLSPTLGAILTTAANTRSEAEGALLLAFYSAGLAVPFIATALFFGYMTSAFERVKRHYVAVITVGGVVLVAIGVLIVTGEFTVLNQEANKVLPPLG
jgi:cytochrome c-type biogenesis protein